MAGFKDTRTIDQLVRDVGATTPKEAAPYYGRFAKICAFGGTLPLINFGVGVVFYPQAPLLLGLPISVLLLPIACVNYWRYQRLNSA